MSFCDFKKIIDFQEKKNGDEISTKNGRPGVPPLVQLLWEEIKQN